MADFTLQVLHASDQEAGVPALQDAVGLSAVMNALDDQYENSLKLTSGDLFIAGPFFLASRDIYDSAAEGEPAGQPGIADILIQNALGWDAAAVGNHEFDAGDATFFNLLAPNPDLINGAQGGQGIGDEGYLGALFPYLATNLDYSAATLPTGLSVVSGGGAPLPNTLTSSVIADVNGDQVGILAAVTPYLPTIANIGRVEITTGDDITSATPIAQQVEALVSTLMPEIQRLQDADINKIILMTHLQEASIEQALAQRLADLGAGVDIHIGGGSHRVMTSEDTIPPLREDETQQISGQLLQPYPQPYSSGTDTVYYVNTGANYRYLSQLVATFDENGVITEIGDDSGTFATDIAGVDRLYDESVTTFDQVKALADPEVVAIVDGVGSFVNALDGNIFGQTEVFLNGIRGDVRTQETNLGNLTADANDYYAEQYLEAYGDAILAGFDGIDISIKNGGGIRDLIGQSFVAGGGGELVQLPPAANPNVGKEEGDVSQLDISNSLRFDNSLVVGTTTAAGLYEIAEHMVARVEALGGQFGQIGGFRFSYDPTAQARTTEIPGERIQNLALLNDDGTIKDVIVEDGTLVGDPDRTFSVVTLSFLAEGGDSYPLVLENLVSLGDFAEPESLGLAELEAGGEQDALAEYLAAEFNVDNGQAPFAVADTPREEDERIQNLAFRDDTVIDAPVAAPSLLQPLGTYETGVFDASAAEIVVHDPVSQRLFVVNANVPTVEVLDVSDPSNLTKLFDIDPSAYGAGANSVAVFDGLVAIAIEAEEKTDPGRVVFFDIDGNFLNAVTVGALPDMLTFTPDGTKVLVANEGEPNDDYSVDPEGSISIIDVSGGVTNLTQANVTTADFTAFNDQQDELIAAGVRIFGPNATVAQDVEPEYIAVTGDSSTAYVSLQENNALAVVDIESGTVTDILPLGFKSHAENPLDASDRDDTINITTYPNLFGLYQPDAISLYEAGGATYIVTANEGDARDYETFSEEARVKDLALDPIAFPNAAELQADEALGRLTVTTTLGDADGDGLYEELYAFGGRSFSIWDTQGNLVYDSGAELETTIAELFPDDFNADNAENDSFDNRSDNKGPEPEGLAIGEIDGRTYAFIGLERFGGVVTYDITNPAEAFFVDFVNNRDFSGDPEAGTAGDLGPEGVTFISAAHSPNGNPLVVVANEVSGSTTVFDASALESPDAEVPGLFLDLRDITGNALTSFTVNREAAFNNFVGFYRVTDIEGGLDITGDGIADITPGQAGYTEAALAARADTVALTTANRTESVFESTVAGGSLYAPFLIANGDLNTVNANQVYFAFGAANADGVEHIRFANGALEFEDLFGGGDNDFNDMVVTFVVSV